MVAGQVRGQPTELVGHVVNRIAVTPSGAITGAEDGTIRRWVVEPGLRPVVVLDDHAGEVFFAAFSPDGTRVATASADGTAKVWQAIDGQPVATLRPGGEIHSARFSDDGARLILAGDRGVFTGSADGSGDLTRVHSRPSLDATFIDTDGSLLVIERDDRRRVLIYPANGDRPSVFPGRARISPFAPLDRTAARVLTFSDSDAFIHSTNGEFDTIELTEHTELVLDVTFSPDDHQVLTASSDSTMRLWDASTGKPLGKFEGAGTEVELARFSPDGSQVVTYSAEHMIRFWDMDGRVLKKVQAASPPYHVEYSRDGQRALIMETSLVRVVSTNVTSDPIILAGHSGRIWHAEFSPDGDRIVTANADKTARIYAIDWPTIRDAMSVRVPRIVVDED